MLFVIACLFFCLKGLQANSFKLVTLDSTGKDVFIRDSRVKYFIDSSSIIKEDNFFEHLNLFKTSTVRNLYNTKTQSKYWLYFSVLNKSSNEDFVLEFYDFNIEDVSVYVFKNGVLDFKNQSGYNAQFSHKILHHKNFAYPLHLNNKDTLEFFVGVQSSEKILLKPAIKTQDRYIKYSLQEYYILGIFYGVLVLVVFFNIMFFLVTRELNALFYVGYILCISFYSLTQDGLGFQYFWPNHPHLNSFADTLSLSMSTASLLLFSNAFLKLDRRDSYIIHSTVLLVLIAFCLDIFLFDVIISKGVLLIAFQICMFLGIKIYRQNKKMKDKWFILSFVTLNIFFFVRTLEFLNLIESSIFTVYSQNIGIVLQFVCLSLGIAEDSKNELVEKNEALEELLFAKKENDALRLIELKRQMNPHFLFNALNSIQSRILINQNEAASDLLLKFSKLIRKNLEISDTQFILFSEEILLIKTYLQIEKIRLGDSFNYEINVDSRLNVEEEQIPTFLIQPLVENAIWHGFSGKKDDQKITLHFKSTNTCIEILIYDNGVGIQHDKKRKKHNSKGLSIVQERLSLIEKSYAKRISLDLISPYEEGKSGTLAKIILWK